MRKIIIIVLLAALIFAISACSGNRNMSRRVVVDERMERNLKAIDDTRRALAAIGTDVDNTDGFFVAEVVQPESSNEPDYSRDYSEYIELPINILSIEKPGKNKFTGDRYYFNGYVQGSIDFDGQFEYFDIYVSLEDNVNYKSMLIAGMGTEEGWSDIELGDSITVYFQYLGYMDDWKQHLGHYEYYEIYKPW